LRNKRLSASLNISVIEDELLSANSSLLQRREKEPNLLQPAAKQKPDHAAAQYIISPPTVAGIV